MTLDSHRLFVSCLLGLIFGLFCSAIAGAGAPAADNDIQADNPSLYPKTSYPFFNFEIIFNRFSIGLVIGLSGISPKYWAIQGPLVGSLISLSLAFSSYSNNENPELSQFAIFTATIVMGALYGFAIEFISTKLMNLGAPQMGVLPRKPRIVHFDIPADNPERARNFYKQSFGWESIKWTEGSNPYWFFITGAEHEQGINGGLVNREPGSNATIANYIQVKSIDEQILKIVGNGGEMTGPVACIPHVGYMASFIDTEGNSLGLFQDDKSVQMKPKGI